MITKMEEIELKNEFETIIEDIETNETVQRMREFRQHCSTTCYEHCKQVAYYSYLICKKHNLDYSAAARAGMLHDLFLYDWRIKRADRKRFHGFRHPRIALNNSMNEFNLTKKERDIILKHMWPITVILPKYKESYIVSFVDTYCACKEFANSLKALSKAKRLYRYAYVFLCLLFIRVV